MGRFADRCTKQKTGSTALAFGLVASLISLAVVTGASVTGAPLGAMFAALGADVTTLSTNVAAVTL